MDLRKSYSLKIDEKNFDKLRVVAKSNHRSVNAQIEALVADCIRAYEDEHGEIMEPDNK